MLIFFNALILCGFRYCYSKTVVDELADRVSIYLTPVYSKPDIHKLPFIYDTYFILTEEPRQMAKGIDIYTNVLVNLSGTLLKECDV
jgi:hypothetical protein